MEQVRRVADVRGWFGDLAKWSQPGMHVKRWLVLL